jgi:Arc/MetJ-type ribon-helix-helix transcriptional regulator
MLEASPPIRRLNVPLPEPLACFVGAMTGEHGLYETPSEFVRDLIRQAMSKHKAAERAEIDALLVKSLKESDYKPWTGKESKEILASLDQ